MHSLTAHPAYHSRLVTAVNVETSYTTGRLRLRYVIGTQDHVKWPKKVMAERRDELWKTTCFELFIKNRLSGEYLELNFSPSTMWAAYSFSSYRAGMATLQLASDPVIMPMMSVCGSAIDVDLDLRDVWPEFATIGLSAIVEENDGTKSYWALAHPAGEPDFHHADCFALKLEAPRKT